METLLSVCLGIGLSAACGFRLFVPLLVMSVASLSGHLTLAHGFEWIGTYPALIAFAVATCAEIGGYYIPWLDNLLDTIASPAAVIAGALISASVITDMSPFMKWTLAIIAGGGAAGIVQGTTVVARGASTAGTGGLGNPVVATVELVSSLLTSVLFLVFAAVAPILLILLLGVLIFFVSKKFFRKSPRPLPG